MRISPNNQPGTHFGAGYLWAMILMAIALLIPSTAHAAQGVSVRVDPEEVGVGGMVTYRITAQVEGNHAIRIHNDPEFDNSFRIQATSDAPGLSVHNGHARRSLTRTYRLRVTREGNFTINAPQITLGDQIVTPESVKLRVVAGTPAPKSANGAPNSADISRDPAFIEHHLAPTSKPYIGQQITLSYALLSDAFKNNISPHPPDEPSFDDFWVEDLSQDFAGQRQTIRRAGTMFTRTNLRAYALFPLSAGSAQIEALEMNAIVTGRFGRRELARLSTDPIDIEVRPLPANPPESFREGNVGEWKFEVTADRLSAKMGDPITVRVRASGSGQVRRVTLPALPAIEGVEVAGKRSNTDPTITSGIVGGTRTDEYTLVAQREGEVVIPELEFGYFDPIEERYKTQRSAQTPIQIQGGEVALIDQSAQTPSEPASATEPENPSEALLKTLDAPRDTISAPAARSPLAGHPAYWFFLALPLLGIAGLGLERPLRRRINARQPRQGRTKSYQKARAILRDASNALAESPQNSYLLLDAIRDALHIYATEVAQIPAGDVSAAKLPDHLKKRGVSAALADRLGELLREIQDLRYSPTHASAHTPQQWVEICQNCLRELEQERRKNIWSASAVQLLLSVFFVTLICPMAILSIPSPALANAPAQAEEPTAQTATELHQQALNAQNNGDWQGAAALWARALDANPESVDILFNLALAHAHSHHFGHARLYLERASLLRPNDRQVERNLKKIRRLIRLHQVEAARGALSASTRVDTSTEGLFWWSVLTQITPNALAMTLLIFAWLLLITQIAGRFLRSSATQRTLKVISWFFVCGVVCGALLWVARARIVPNIRPAVIMTDGILLRDGPSTHAGLIELDTMAVPGVMVPTSAENDDWVKLNFTADTAAWTQVDNIEYVAPR